MDQETIELHARARRVVRALVAHKLPASAAEQRREALRHYRSCRDAADRAAEQVMELADMLGIAGEVAS